MRTKIASIALVVIFLTAASFKSTRETTYKGRSELDQLFSKAKTEHKELAKFEEDYQSYFQKTNADRISFNQKINARAQLHQQAKALLNSIRNENVKKHITTIQNSYYAQFQELKQKQAGMVKPINDELAISTDWFNAMKVAYVLEQNRLLEREIERELDNNEVSLSKIKELNATGKKIVTKMLSPAD